MTNLSHTASFHSNEGIAPSNHGIKHLEECEGIVHGGAGNFRQYKVGMTSKQAFKMSSNASNVADHCCLITLQDGTVRFSKMRCRVTCVSERMLAQTLRWLEQDRLVARRSYDVVPPHTGYTLTEIGSEAAAKGAEFADWIEERGPLIRDPLKD